MEELFRKHREEGPNWLRFEYALVARCASGRHVLVAGVGRAGVGRMWRAVQDGDDKDELWGELPVQQCVGLGMRDPCPGATQQDMVHLLLLNGHEEVIAARAEARRGQA